MVKQEMVLPIAFGILSAESFLAALALFACIWRHSSLAKISPAERANAKRWKRILCALLAVALVLGCLAYFWPAIAAFITSPAFADRQSLLGSLACILLFGGSAVMSIGLHRVFNERKPIGLFPFLVGLCMVAAMFAFYKDLGLDTIDWNQPSYYHGLFPN